MDLQHQKPSRIHDIHWESPLSLPSFHNRQSTTNSNLLYPAAEAITEDFCGRFLDKYPDIKTLKRLHAKIFFDPGLRSNPSIGIKLMKAYADCSQPGISRHIFYEIPDKDVVLFNVMIRIYMNDQYFCGDALLLFRTMSNYSISPHHYTYPSVLKACSGSENLWVGMQCHAAVIKVGLDRNLFVGNGLVAMYGKCGCLLQACQVLDEMPHRTVVSWNSMVAGFAQNGLFYNALGVCREMELFGSKITAKRAYHIH